MSTDEPQGSIPHLADRAKALAEHGWTGDDAEWLTLCACTRACSPERNSARTSTLPAVEPAALFKRLVTTGVATERDIPGERRPGPGRPPQYCHVRNRTLYPCPQHSPHQTPARPG